MRIISNQSTWHYKQCNFGKKQTVLAQNVIIIICYIFILIIASFVIQNILTIEHELSFSGTEKKFCFLFFEENTHFMGVTCL